MNSDPHLVSTKPVSHADWVIVTLSFFLYLLAASPAYSAEKPVVAAASSLNGSLEEISLAFTRDTGEQVRVSYGSSGNLTRQIMQGAPFELFLSADEGYTKALTDKDLTTSASEVYATGRLVLFIPRGSALVADPTLDDLADALSDGRLQRLAIANPDHAPYGRAAREVLTHLQLWEQVQGKMLLGENVVQAAQFAGSGDVDAGIISASIALEPAMASKGTHVMLPGSWHSPLNHHMVLLGNAGPVSRAFHSYLRRDEARAIFRKFGFSTPMDTQ